LLRDLEGAVLDTLIVASADALATRAPSPDTPERIPPLLKTVSMLMDYYFLETPHGVLKPLLTGNDIMKTLHLGPGKEIGRLLALIREAEREGRITTKEDARALIAAEHAQAAVRLGEKGELGET
jgi:hypothetical protein